MNRNGLRGCGGSTRRAALRRKSRAALRTWEIRGKPNKRSGRIALFVRNKLKLTSSAARWLCHLCNQPDSGSVGLCVQVVEYATMLAETRGLSGVDQPLLAEALRCGVTHQRADLLIQEIEQEPPRLVAAAG